MRTRHQSRHARWRQHEHPVVKIGMLKGTLPMDTGVANELAMDNTAKAQYPALIAMDHFANGGTAIDANRFVLTG